ncbi:MAG TPA: AMP-binding protein, partial [Longimicrobium sp.]|nr:AMP-binding protein [Longimicrobium sp.]
MRDPYETLAARAAEDPGRTAFRHLTYADGGDVAGAAETVTYGGLLARADAVARALAERAAPGERVVLLYPNGLAFVAALFGCVAAGVVAVPAPPPSPGRQRRALPRLRAIVDDASPRLIATDRATLPTVAELAAGDPALAALEPLATDALEPAAGGFARPAGRGGLLCLQYTSGSTSTPRGVMVTRDALWHNSEAIRLAWGYGPGSRSVMWVPNFHDDGLVHGIVQPVHAGFPCTLMSPLDLLARPARWMRAVSDFAATHSGGPNFAYELAVRKTGPAERQGLELGSWRVAYNAAEPVRLDTLRRFHEAFRAHGFRWRAFHPSFGLAEATLLVTTGGADEDPAAVHADPRVLEHEQRLAEAAPGAGRPLAGCGRPVEGTRVAVVDPEARLALEDGRVGEIWVASRSLAAGYWRRPEATAETFGATLADGGGGPFLRTGDLGFL